MSNSSKWWNNPKRPQKYKDSQKRYSGELVTAENYDDFEDNAERIFHNKMLKYYLKGKVFFKHKNNFYAVQMEL